MLKLSITWHDPNVVGDHFGCERPLRSSCIEEGVMSTVGYVPQWKEDSYQLYEHICLYMFSVYFTANPRISRTKFF